MLELAQIICTSFIFLTLFCFFMKEFAAIFKIWAYFIIVKVMTCLSFAFWMESYMLVKSPLKKRLCFTESTLIMFSLHMYVDKMLF